jgi:hypothetical protein
MATDPNPALRDELNAALNVLAPQIRGLHDLAAVSINPELMGFVNAQITARERRRDLIRQVLANLDTTVVSLQAVEADGYPALSPVVVAPTVFSELKGEMDDLAAAAAVFKADIASRMAIGLGAAEAKPDVPVV